MEQSISTSWSTLSVGATNAFKKHLPIVDRRFAVDKLLHDGLPYSKKLVAHTSCVNALVFSGDGRWLASAGDDPYVQLWDFNQENLSASSARFVGPRSNVFTLAFSASGQYLYCGDSRSNIYQYDLSDLRPSSQVQGGAGSPCWRDNQHEDSIRAISCHPEDDHLFLSASEDGRIILHDMRTNPAYTRAQSTFQHDREFTCVQYHPTMPNLFATSDNRDQVCLRDVRMTFGPLSQRRNKGVVQEYVTTIAKQGQARMACPEVSSLVFDRDGRRLAVTMLHHTPTMYALNDPYPIATFSGRNLPDGTPVPPGEKTYSNSCTMKHGTFGSFGSDRDMYYAQGSDDFRTYVWKIPEECVLLEGRTVVEHSDWIKNERPGEIGYASSYTGPRYVPVDISTPLARLTGHDSIVNTALIHPHRPFLLTAGIERYIRLHSPTSTTSCTEPLERTPTAVRTVMADDPSSRELYLRAMGMVDDPTHDESDDDGEAIQLFDEILRQESNADVFRVRPWEPSVSMDSEDEVVFSDEDSDMGTVLY